MNRSVHTPERLPGESLEQYLDDGRRDAAAWSYLPPHCPPDYPEQCYYRAEARRLSFQMDDEDTRITVYRHAPDNVVGLTVEHQHGSASINLGASALVKLRDAILDALHDIAAVEAERELNESFDRISEEMRDADADGHPGGVLYAHPWIHYVPASNVEAKVAELMASGAKRWMVLPEAVAEGEHRLPEAA